SRSLSVLIDRNGRMLLSPAAGGHVQRNAVKPRVKSAGTLERLQLDESPDKGILAHVARFLARTRHMNQRVVKPVLVSGHQRRKRRRVPTNRFVDKLEFVVHNFSKLLDAFGPAKVPACSLAGISRLRAGGSYPDGGNRANAQGESAA